MTTIDIKAMSLPMWLYVVGWLCYLYLFIQILTFDPQTSSNLFLSGLQFLNFGIHEISHLFVFFLPALLVALAGSLGEIVFPLLIVGLALRSKSYFAAIFASLWAMLAFQSVGRYIADARSQLLPLMGPSETVQHDWHFILGQIGWLNYDTLLGGSLRMIGTIIGASALVFGAYLIIMKLIDHNPSPSPITK